ncbi:hypothetical protein ACQW02_09620 [Humitalea sp. 24SJ18S-53]|uniref:hypothetical protein n=1 Tax=Humitalea sp. 24SJ18S-53 TaxID=3422307 RepID=UPI003D66469F
MSDWDLGADGLIQLDPVVSFAAGVASGYSQGPLVMLRVESVLMNDLAAKSKFDQFLLSPQQAAKLAEMLATTARSAMISSQ